jgi:hypothetical protein
MWPRLISRGIERHAFRRRQEGEASMWPRLISRGITWYSIRIHSSMIPKIKHLAVYRVKPESAITHIAPVSTIEQWQQSNKYVVNFAEPAKQSLRYTSRQRLEKAKTLDDMF